MKKNACSSLFLAFLIFANLTAEGGVLRIMATDHAIHAATGYGASYDSRGGYSNKTKDMVCGTNFVATYTVQLPSATETFAVYEYVFSDGGKHPELQTPSQRYFHNATVVNAHPIVNVSTNPVVETNGAWSVRYERKSVLVATFRTNAVDSATSGR